MLGNFGKFRYILEAGTILGNPPFPLLEVLNIYENNGLGRYSVHPVTESLFAADSYVNLENGLVTNGILFNHIPLINRLNLREIFGVRLAYGHLSRHYLPNNVTPLEKPFIQLSAGICNIFKIIAIEYLWEYMEAKSPNTNWGIQAKLFVDF